MIPYPVPIEVAQEIMAPLTLKARYRFLHGIVPKETKHELVPNLSIDMPTDEGIYVSVVLDETKRTVSLEDLGSVFKDHHPCIAIKFISEDIEEVKKYITFVQNIYGRREITSLN